MLALSPSKTTTRIATESAHLHPDDFCQPVISSSSSSFFSHQPQTSDPSHHHSFLSTLRSQLSYLLACVSQNHHDRQEKQQRHLQHPHPHRQQHHHQHYQCCQQHNYYPPTHTQPNLSPKPTKPTSTSTSTIYTQTTNTETEITEITKPAAETEKHNTRKPTIILDLRSTESFQQTHIPTSLSLPLPGLIPGLAGRDFFGDAEAVEKISRSIEETFFLSRSQLEHESREVFSGGSQGFGFGGRFGFGFGSGFGLRQGRGRESGRESRQGVVRENGRGQGFLDRVIRREREEKGDDGTVVVVLCYEGGASQLATSALRKEGIEAYCVKGGFEGLAGVLDWSQPHVPR